MVATAAAAVSAHVPSDVVASMLVVHVVDGGDVVVLGKHLLHRRFRRRRRREHRRHHRRGRRRPGAHGPAVSAIDTVEATCRCVQGVSNLALPVVVGRNEPRSFAALVRNPSILLAEGVNLAEACIATAAHNSGMDEVVHGHERRNDECITVVQLVRVAACLCCG